MEKLECSIKNRCKELGVTIKWLSEDSGVPLRTIYDATQGRSISIIPVIKIANSLSCNIEELWKIELT